MTPGGARAGEHPSLDALADLDEELLDDERRADLTAHVAGCGRCAASLAALHEVRTTLAVATVPPMPAAVAARLDRVLVAEAELREATDLLDETEPIEAAEPVGDGPLGLVGGLSTARPARSARVSLGRFGAGRRFRRGVLMPALAAAAAAAVVGFGAYVVSASAGLNEPPVVAAVTSSRLGVQAGALEAKGNLAPHRFSRAWQCARQATDGRIVGLANTSVDGVPALLVYTRAGAALRVTVVTGCATGNPRPGPYTTIPG